MNKQFIRIFAKGDGPVKRTAFMLLAIVLLISLAACSAPTSEPEESTTPSTAPSTAPSATQESQETVVFADPVLEAMVRGTMGKPEGAITVADAGAVTRLDISFDWQQYVSGATPIADLSGLEHFRNLESLDLSLHAITDITPLASLTELTQLVLNGNPIADIAPLAGLTRLKVLTLAGCAARDYSPLAKLNGLELLIRNGSI
jgi:internalin A